MAENQTKSQKTSKNDKEPQEFWQNHKTPMSPAMIYEAVQNLWPDLFPEGSELVKLTGGDIPVFETQRKIA